MDENETNEEPVYYFSHEDRIKDASPTVKAHYDGTEPQPPRGIFKCLVATRASRCALYALLLSLALFIGFYFFGSKGNEAVLGGVKYTLSAFSFEDKVYVSVKVANSSDADKDNKINVQILTVDNENQVTNKVNFTEKDEKDFYFRTVFVNHDIIKVTAEITDAETSEQISLSCKVEEK